MISQLSNLAGKLSCPRSVYSRKHFKYITDIYDLSMRSVTLTIQKCIYDTLKNTFVIPEHTNAFSFPSSLTAEPISVFRRRMWPLTLLLKKN